MSASLFPRNRTPCGRMMAPFPRALERRDQVQQECVIAVLLRRDAVNEAPELVVVRVEPAGPGLGGERRIGHGEVEGSEPAVPVLEIRRRQGVGSPQLGGGVSVQEHVHPRQRPGGDVHFLAVDRDAARRLVGGLEEQRAGTAGGIVDGLVLTGVGADADHLRHDARDLRRGVELSLALAALGREMAHQIFVGIAQEVVAFGTVGAEVEAVEDRHQLGEPVLHFLARAELALVIEVGLVDDALEIVGLREEADDLVDLVADLLVALELHHVGKAAGGGYFDQRAGLAGVLVRYVFREQQREDVVLVLRGVHAAAEFVAALPEGGVELGFFQRHSANLPHRNAMRSFTRFTTARATRSNAATSCSSTSIAPSYSARLRLRWAWSSTRHCSRGRPMVCCRH